MNIKKEFYKTDKKTRAIYYIYSGISAVLLFIAFVLNYTGKDIKTSLIVAEMSVTMLSVGVWGGVFFEIMMKKFKK